MKEDYIAALAAPPATDAHSMLQSMTQPYQSPAQQPTSSSQAPLAHLSAPLQSNPSAADVHMHEYNDAAAFQLRAQQRPAQGIAVPYGQQQQQPVQNIAGPASAAAPANCQSDVHPARANPACMAATVMQDASQTMPDEDICCAQQQPDAQLVPTLSAPIPAHLEAAYSHSHGNVHSAARHSTGSSAAAVKPNAPDQHGNSAQNAASYQHGTRQQNCSNPGQQPAGVLDCPHRMQGGIARAAQPLGEQAMGAARGHQMGSLGMHGSEQPSHSGGTVSGSAAPGDKENAKPSMHLPPVQCC